MDSSPEPAASKRVAVNRDAMIRSVVSSQALSGVHVSEEEANTVLDEVLSKPTVPLEPAADLFDLRRHVDGTEHCLCIYAPAVLALLDAHAALQRRVEALTRIATEFRHTATDTYYVSCMCAEGAARSHKCDWHNMRAAEATFDAAMAALSPPRVGERDGGE